MKVRINVNLAPSDGRYFKEKDGTTIRGNSWPGLIRRVVEYRQRNGFPVGDVEQEIHDQVCKRAPAICNQSSAVTDTTTRQASLKGRVLLWFSRIREARDKRNELEFVSKTEAAQRAEICAKCPNNTPYPGGCSTCKRVVSAMRADVLKNLGADARLNACAILGEDTATSVHLEQQRVDNRELPAECWRKRAV